MYKCLSRRIQSKMLKFCYRSIFSQNNCVIQGSKLTGMERARRNVIKTMLYITVVHILCWSLNQILYAASQIFGIYVDRNGIPYIMSVVIVYLNCWVNPIIYVTCYKAFRQDLKRRRALRGSKVKSSTLVTGSNQSARSDI